MEANEAADKEQEYVHKVYNEIAPHFSQTRYKPWPIVTQFLQTRANGAIGIDVGCGNGKYLGVNPNVYIIGSDRSDGLIECARGINPSYNLLVADGLNLPHRDNTFDFAISIAVVHHWSTRERRVEVIRHVLSKLRQGGQALIYCWALEQGSSRRGYHEGMEQDVYVPWVLPKGNLKPKSTSPSQPKPKPKPDLTNIPPKERTQYLQRWKEEQQRSRDLGDDNGDHQQEQEQKQEDVKYRYYHLYREGELAEDCRQADAAVQSEGFERDNWWVVAQKR
ncbi:trm9p [Saccharomyces arboricola H-6]|uniref:Trm9p n=1 Tax=Saccharomyces arboricola (strain H-6 / AS 2.3317 / CBS 10644) TaxID=1160507 RepID=J8PJW3_SACAR|nr:trm9p [Saccharomyces arboricola H-6]